MRHLIDFWKGLPERRKDAFCLLLLIAFCLVLFSKTVFSGQPISRIFELANLDYLFRQAIDAPTKYDVHCIFMKISGYLLAATTWREGTIPFWNPYIGCGAPLLAELQSIVLSPWMFFYTLWPSLQMHNYLLVAQQVLGAVGMFLSARALGLSRYAAIFAAVVHLCCPHQQWREELQMNHSFYPITVWFFIRLYQTRNFLWALAAGIGCAAQILSGDAQVSLLSISVVSALFVLMNLLGEERKDALIVRVRDGGVWLAIAGFNALCFASPVFLGFVEWVRIGDLSKKHAYYSVGNPATWESLAYSLLHPGFGGSSLYAGCLTLPLICLSFLAIKQRRPYYLSVLLTAVFAFMSASRTGPFPLIDGALGLMGLSRFEGMEVYLIQIAFLMAFGLEELVNDRVRLKSIAFGLLVAACLCVITIPAWLAKTGFNLEKITFDSHVEAYGFQPQLWNVDVVLLCVFLLLVGGLAFSRAKLPSTASLLLILVPILLNSTSEVLACQKSLPHLPKFRYPKLELLDFLASKQQRVVPVGYNLLHPNNNVVYRIPSLAYEGPLVPPRLHEFVRAAGAHADAFTKVFPNGSFNKLINLASVRYIVSFVPVRNSDEPYNFQSPIAKPVSFKGNENIRMDAAKVQYDAEKNELGGYIDWYVKEGEGENYIFQIAMFGEDGKLFWTGGPFYTRQREYLKDDTRPKTFSRMPLDAIVPEHIPESTKFSIGIKVRHLPEESELEPENSATPVIKNMFEIAQFTKQVLPLERQRRFKMVKEIPNSFIRIYENLHAMPTAYLVHKTILVEGDKNVLDEIGKSSFDPHSVAVIEDRNLKAMEGEHAGSANDEVRAVRSDSNTLKIDVNTESDGLLVVTDQYFPGWHAEVDGVEVPIVYANYLFKGIPVGPGRHKVSLFFRPTYINLSFALLGANLLLNGAAWLVLRRRRRKDISVSTAAASGAAEIDGRQEKLMTTF